MKKGKILSAFLTVLILAISGGSFAWTYLTAIQTISVTGAGADIAKVVADGSPTWPAMHGKQVGTLPETSLFKITPDANYTGDLLVSVYLTNAGELIQCYQHLNMKIEFFDNTGAKIGRTEFLTLKNGVVVFEMNYGTGWDSPYRVKITGGSYNTLKGTAESGESFTPVFYCEVSQR